MNTPTARAQAREEPLASFEMTVVEAVPVTLRVRAPIGQSWASELVVWTAVDHPLQRLIGDRFLRDATPVVDGPAAKRAARQLTGDK